MKSIYVLLTCSETVMSRVIHLATAEPYTHVSMAFDPALLTLCSFARYYEWMPLPAGLVRESISRRYNKKHGDMPCALLELQTDEDAFERARVMVDWMFTRRWEYRYSLRGVALCKFGVAEEREDHYFCSQFVGEILSRSGAVTLPKVPSLMHPMDYDRMPELRCVFRGPIKELIGRLAAAMVPLDVKHNV